MFNRLIPELHGLRYSLRLQSVPLPYVYAETSRPVTVRAYLGFPDTTGTVTRQGR